MSLSLDPEQAHSNACSDLVSNCMLRLSAEDKSLSGKELSTKLKLIMEHK